MKRLAIALSVVALSLPGTVLAQGQADAPAAAAAGKRLYLRCIACHSLSASGPAKVGPHLQGIVGRRAAAVPRFNYSPALARSGLVWNEATLDRWLQRPPGLVPGTTMAFAGLSDPAQRRALIAYLRNPK